MKHLAVVVAALALIAQPSSSATKLDSILDVTGGLQMKMIWVHWQIADQNYNVINSDAASSLQLMGYDTKLGKEYLIDSVKGSVLCYVRITFDGKWALWSDPRDNGLWCRDMAAATPATKLNSGAYWFLYAVQYDSATQTNWIFASDDTDPARFPLSADGKSVDMTKKVVYSGAGMNSGNYAVFASSADFKYLGGGSIGIWDVARNTWLNRHLDGVDAFGCQPDIAPDNSYRFFYLNDTHRILRMYPPALSAAQFNVQIGGLDSISKLPILPNSRQSDDCQCPRWTNNVRLFSTGYPLTTGYVGEDLENVTPGWSAAQFQQAVQQKDPLQQIRTCIGRFSADYRKVEKYAMVSNGDIRNQDWMADAWIGPPQVAARPETATRAHTTATSRIALRGNLVDATFPGSGPGMLTLVDSQGRTQAQASGQGTVVCSLEGLPAGAYVVKAVGADGISSKTVVISR